PQQQYTYDPDNGKALLKEAGYGSDKPIKAKIMITNSGSGQMLPLPMNEYLQQNLKECNFDISFEVVDWGTMLVALRNPPTAPQALNSDAMNTAWRTRPSSRGSRPFSCPARFRQTASTGQTGRIRNTTRSSTRSKNHPIRKRSRPISASRTRCSSTRPSGCSSCTT